jgi:hypothetical protein
MAFWPGHDAAAHHRPKYPARVARRNSRVRSSSRDRKVTPLGAKPHPRSSASFSTPFGWLNKPECANKPPTQYCLSSGVPTRRRPKQRTARRSTGNGAVPEGKGERMRARSRVSESRASNEGRKNEVFEVADMYCSLHGWFHWGASGLVETFGCGQTDRKGRRAEWTE